MIFSVPIRDQVDVWWLNLTQNPPIRISVLDQSEMCRAQNFATQDLKQRFERRRAWRRWILSAYCTTPPEDLRFDEGPHGKPTLQQHPDLHFNQSHAGDLSLLAVAGVPIGADVEAVKNLPDLEALANSVCTPSELDEVLKAAHPPEIMFRIWVEKEALIKLSGLGLRADLTSVQTGPQASHPVQQLEAPSGYAAALAGIANPQITLRDPTDLKP